MRVGVINVPSKVGHHGWARCFDLTASRAPVFGINEAFLRAAKQTYVQKARKHELGFAGIKGPNPVFWSRNAFKRISSRQHELHARGSSHLAARYPGFNDARFVTEVVLEDRHGSDGEFVILCTHWVPEGVKVPAAWRAWARMEAKRGVRKIARRHRRAGKVVWLIGDTNIKEAFGMGRRFRWIRGVGIDKIGVWVPKGMRLADFSYVVFPAPTDHHHGVVGRAEFAPA